MNDTQSRKANLNPTNYRYARGTENSAESVEFDLVSEYAGFPTTCVVNADLLICGLSTFPCGNGDDVRLALEQKRDILKFISEEREKIIHATARKSVKDWYDSGLPTFEDYFEPGDIVTEDVVDHFLNMLPPAAMKSGFLQVGEEFNREYDPKAGKIRSTFCTFFRDSGEWKFAGYCFINETENRFKGPGRLAERLAEVEAQINKAKIMF